jgi:hypothetical protein
MQPVPITSDVLSSNLDLGEVFESHSGGMIYPLVNKQGRTLYIHHKFKQDQIFMYKVVYVFVVFLFFVCLFV